MRLQVGHRACDQYTGAAGGSGLSAAGGLRDEQQHLSDLRLKNDIPDGVRQFLTLRHADEKPLEVPLAAGLAVQHGELVHPVCIFQIHAPAGSLPEGIVDLDDQTIRLGIVDIEVAGVVDLRGKVDQLPHMDQIHAAVHRVAHRAAADGEHQLVIRVGVHHRLLVFPVRVPCDQKPGVAQPHPRLRFRKDIIYIMCDPFDAHSHSCSLLKK